MAETPKPAAPSSNATLEALAQTLMNSSGPTTSSLIGLPDAMPELPEVAPTEKIPRYSKGHEWIPILSGRQPGEIRVLQEQMVRLGLLDSDFNAGSWDEPSRRAFEELLAQSNGSGVEYTEMMTILENSAPMEIGPDGIARRRALGSGSKKAAKVLQLTNPLDLVATANEVAQKRIGRTFSQDELQRFVSSYQGVESGAQSAAHAAGGADGGGGTIVTPPSDENAADQFAKEIDPVAFEARNMLPMVESINSLLNGEGQVDTPTPLQGGF